MNRLTTAWRQASAAALTLVAAIVVTAYLISHGSDLQPVCGRQPVWLLMLLTLTVLRVALTAEMHRRLLAALGSPLRRMECFWLANVASAGNLLLPLHGGTGIRALYLKRQHGVTYRHFAVQLFRCQLLLAFTTGLVAAISLLALFAPWCAAIVVGSISVPILAAIGFSHFRNNEAWQRHWPLVGLALALRCVDTAMFATSCLAAGWMVRPIEATTLASTGSLATLVQLTPGGLGVSEAMVAIVSGAAGLTAAQAVAATLLVRGVDLIRAALFGVAGSWLLQRQLHAKCEQPAHWLSAQRN